MSQWRLVGFFLGGANFQILRVVKTNFGSHTPKAFITESYFLGQKVVIRLKLLRNKILSIFQVNYFVEISKKKSTIKDNIFYLFQKKSQLRHAVSCKNHFCD